MTLRRHESGIASRSSSSRPAWPNRSETGHGLPEGHQRRVDAVLERRAMPDQMQPVARELALATDRRVGQPDRRHQVAPGQLGQHTGIDLVRLACQRREPLDLLRVGDQHLPAELFERVVHKPRPGHRLDHRPHPLTTQPLSKLPQPARVRRHAAVLDELAGVVDKAHIESTPTQIQPNVQHESGPPPARSSDRHAGACHRGGPLSSQSEAGLSRAPRSAPSPRIHRRAMKSMQAGRSLPI